MARYAQRFASPLSAQQVCDTVSSYLQSENFEYINLNGEGVWKKGHGVMTAPQYIKLIVLNDGTYVVEAWLKNAILPGVYVGEMGLNGFYAAVPKGFLKARVDNIFKNVNAQMLQLPQQMPPQAQQQFQQPQEQPQQAPQHPFAQQNNNNNNQ